MIKVKISQTIPETVNDLVLKLARSKKVKPSQIALEQLPSGISLFEVSIASRNIGTISQAFDSMMFIPN